MINQLRADLKTAMKEKNKIAKDAISFTIGKAGDYAKKDGNRPVEDSDILRALKSEIKQTEDALAQMKDNLSPDGITELTTRIDVLKKYMPEQLSTEKVQEAIEAVFNDLGLDKSMKSMGTAMKSLQETIGDQVDGKTLSTMVRGFING